MPGSRPARASVSLPAPAVLRGMTTTIKEQRAAKRLEKKQDDLIDRAYMATCSHIQIPMMKIPSIFRFGRTVLNGSADEKDFEELKVQIRAFVDQIAVRPEPAPCSTSPISS